MSEIILPGSTLGVLGSGQLGRMFAIAARRLGYRVHVLSPDNDTPTGQVADVEIKADYHDLEAVAEFARRVSVVTFEFENVPAETTEVAARYAPVRPGGDVLHTTQNRLREKTTLQNAGLPVTPFAAVRSVDELQSALENARLSRGPQNLGLGIRRQRANRDPRPRKRRGRLERTQHGRSDSRSLHRF